MRGKYAIINALTNLAEEFFAIISGLILSRLILSAFGSAYNGLINSISQFLTCAVLLRSGIGGATRAALYKTLSVHDIYGTTGILKATDKFMKKVGIILAFSILVFASIYPLFVKDEFDWIFTFTLFLIIGLSTFAESFFGITYLILLQADQRVWISSGVRSVCYIFNIILTSSLILHGFSIHVVKLCSTLIFCLYPIALGFIVKRTYELNPKAPLNMSVITQRWDAFWHQIGTFVMDNTSIMILTIFVDIKEISVYCIYNMIIFALKRAIQSFSCGLEAVFGNMIAKNETLTLNKSVNVVELVMYSLSTCLFTTSYLLIVPFVKIFTSGINDANYMRTYFAAILLVAQFFNSTRLIPQMIIQAAGHYKQTKKYAIWEPIINILFSIVLVIQFEIIGVAIGTLIATLYRMSFISFYAEKKLLSRTKWIPLFRILVSFCECILTILIVHTLNLHASETYLQWIMNGLIVFSISLIIVVIGDMIFFRKDVKEGSSIVINLFVGLKRVRSRANC